MKRTLFAIAALLVVGYSVYEIAGAKPAPGTTGGPVYAVTSVATRTGAKAVDFSWNDNDGKQHSFSELAAGKVVLLNVWATWCPPCRREIPDLVTISKEMASSGVLVVGVSIDDKKDALTIVKTYSDKNGVSYLHVVDASKKIAEAYGGIQAIPTTFIIDRQGNVAQKIVGSQSKEAFVAALQKAM